MRIYVVQYFCKFVFDFHNISGTVIVVWTIPQNVCFAAEVGLTGEIRPVNRVDQRIFEAQKLGFEKIYISSYNLKGLDLKQLKIEVIAVTKMEEVFAKLFG